MHKDHSMNKRLLHGSRKNDLESLQPQYIGGNNGSVDGIGINLTDSIPLAKHYAGGEGSVYMSDINTADFIEISHSKHLTKEHAECLKSQLEQIDETTRYRLATDICGKAEKAFKSDDDAEAFYKEKRAEFKVLNLQLDRLKPEIDYNDDGDMVILHANLDFSGLEKATTKRMHYCLNLFDNDYATTLLKSICKGLILPREDGITNYLSFAMDEPIVARLDQEFLAKPNAEALIKSSMSKYSSNSFQTNTLEP